MKNTLLLPFCGNHFSLWGIYLSSVSEYLNEKIKDLNLGEVYIDINSLKENGDINEDEIDWITIDDDKPSDISKRIFINFNVDKGSDSGCSKIKFDFLSGVYDENNFKYKEISELYFLPTILGDPDLLKEFASFITSEKINEDYFLKNAC